MTVHTFSDGSVHICRLLRGGFHEDWSSPVRVWASGGRIFVVDEENADTPELRRELDRVLTLFERHGGRASPPRPVAGRHRRAGLDGPSVAALLA